MPVRRGAAHGVVLLVLCLVMAACSSSAVEEPSDTSGASEPEETTADTQASTPDSTTDAGQEAGGEMVVTVDSDPDMLDPTFGATASGREVFANMCEKLYDIDAQGNIIPQLAADLPVLSDDGRTVQIPLREGILFNDGTELNADAVKTSIDRHRTAEGSRRAGELATVEEVTVVDPHTVELSLNAPTAPLTATLADRSGMIMSPVKLEELGENFGEDPVCVGPFSFVSRVVGDEIVLEKSEHYYDADEVPLDRVIFKAVDDGTVRTNNLLSGDLHVVDRVQASDVERLKNDPNVSVLDVTTFGLLKLELNVANENGIGTPPGNPDSPFTDPLVREAFELALDREEINQVAYNGLHVVGCTPIPPISPFAPDIECPTRDVERARELLAEAGVSTPVEVEFLVVNESTQIRLAEVVQTQVAEAGFNVSITPAEGTVAQDAGRAGQFQLSLNPWSGRIDPDGNIWQFHHSQGADNLGNAQDAEVDSLLDEARAETDMERRKELYAEAVELIRERRNTIYLFFTVVYAAHRNEVAGFEMYPDGLTRMKTAHFVDG